MLQLTLVRSPQGSSAGIADFVSSGVSHDANASFSPFKWSPQEALKDCTGKMHTDSNYKNGKNNTSKSINCNLKKTTIFRNVYTFMIDKNDCSAQKRKCKSQPIEKI